LSADGWSLFDTVIVSVSIALISVPGGGNAWVKQLRVGLHGGQLFHQSCLQIFAAGFPPSFHNWQILM
jgi:hypothetical protein